ncbi:hypothetical protein K505DRAFT_229783 [Melanomma pulvis-pyrius CBS 109.77]|uniref:DUF7704 domain-containing protein n=1 Tax=Melanomma pulvis-pyrius CBS 109.77 TaxID=1314802 RepID=A0A6A6XTQ9_9PLEO|nr:hypothetical protein K505DRAFT_229783 [Melanomma pulvis-pyrius CBS 109.77]
MALGTVLPFWPALLFTYLEPVALIVGWQAAYVDPSTYVTSQLPPHSPLSTLTAPPASATILALTLANIFLLLAALAVLCTAITREARVAKFYLAILALADLGHIYASYKVMGPATFWDLAKYNDMMWGNIGASAFLHVNRLATLAGVFGRVGRRR